METIQYGPEAVELNICLVASRRPELLDHTLNSFKRSVFGRARIGTVRANVDPIFGSDDEQQACVQIILRHFQNADIREPESANFGGAVRWLWNDLPNGLMLHLEDDWICKAKVELGRVRNFMQGNTSAVSLLSQTHGPRGSSDFSLLRRKNRLFGLAKLRKRAPCFSTSPGFFEGEFARVCSKLMDPTLDPERQMRPPYNMPLWHYLRAHQCRFYKTDEGLPIIEDIGREWQRLNGVTKTVKGGRSDWKVSGQ